MRPILLMTRPPAASAAFLERLGDRLAAGSCISALIDVTACTDRIDTGAARGLILTSANGVAVASTLLADRNLPCFCVGEATTRAAVAAGWHAQCVGETADALVAALTRMRPAGPLLHLCGVHTRGDVAARLTAAGLATTGSAIYDQHAQPLSSAARALLNGTAPVVVPLFSPRTARLFASEPAWSGNVHAIAMSDAVAAPLAALPLSSLLVAVHPNAEAMAREVENCVNGLTRVESTQGSQ